MTSIRSAAALAAMAACSLGRAARHGAPVTPEFKELRSSFDAKHTPKLSAPGSVKRGQWFEVSVAVGAGGEHPSLSEHHVRYIALYKDTAEIARAYLHPVFSAPRVTFTIALDESGTLRALAEPTHSAAWEASQKITVKP